MKQHHKRAAPISKPRVMSDEYILQAPPSDTISCLQFSPIVGTSELLVSSWDSTTRLYNAHTNQSRMTYYFGGACLSNCFGIDNSTGYSGGLDNSIHFLDLNRGNKQLNGTHGAPVSCLQFNREKQLLLSGSWDKSVSIWDSRQSGRALSVQMPGKVYSMSTCDTKVVVATSERHIIILDMRKMAEHEQHRESSLRHQTRVVAAAPDCQSYTVGSVEGRVAVEYFSQEPEVQARKYAFKCHRQGELAFPVNSISYHPLYGTFATGGCDGIVNIWDGQQKKRLCQLGPYSTSISALAFSADGKMMAIAASYTYEEGEKSNMVDGNVHLHHVNDSAVQPRAKIQ